jgi:hypothetical protein
MTAKAPQRSQARAALAEAIERKLFAERELASARDARSAASRRHYEATEKLEAHRRAVAQGNASEASHIHLFKRTPLAMTATWRR